MMMKVHATNEPSRNLKNGVLIDGLEVSVVVVVVVGMLSAGKFKNLSTQREMT